MQAEQLLRFGLYRLNPQTGQLWRGKQEVKVTPKAAAVLGHLVARGGQVVSKEKLFEAVWPETVVSDAALSSCIQELRQTLRDDARNPRYIETVHRRGFRFLPVVTTQPVQGSKFKVPRSDTQDSALRTQHFVLVGREAELAQLHGWLAKALNGERQIVFVSGEAGIGKTSVVEAFLHSLESRVQSLESEDQQLLLSEVQTLDPRRQILDSRMWIGRGQCIEHYGVGEAYLPVLEALGRLCRAAEGQDVVALLRHQAPSWLVQMPAVVSPAELEELQRRTAGVTRERMLRELAEALEALTAEHALILRLEDLHWSDYSTLDLLSVLARRQERARLLIVGTYRPVEVLTRDHPLKDIKQELQLHGQCEELALDFLSEAAVGEYLKIRFSGGTRGTMPLQPLARFIHQRTDGNPLFMVNVTNELVAREVVTPHEGHWEIQDILADDSIGVPENLRQLIEQQIGRVSAADREVLEAASVTGAEFSAAAVAAGAGKAVEEIEECCDTLARREQFLCTQGTSEWPDGTVATRYQFLHALYQEVLYERIPAARRSRLHRLIGERTEAAYGTQAREIAAELAVHFERGRDYRRAIQYLQHAGENASQRNAYVEAISLLTKGLELLKTLPDTPDRIQQELTLQLALSDALLPVKGHTALEIEKTATRARELCEQLSETPQLFPVLWRLFVLYINRGELQTAQELSKQMMRLAQSDRGQLFLSPAHMARGTTSSIRGELTSARTHLEQAIALYDPQQHLRLTVGAHFDPRVICRGYAAITLGSLGYADQALKMIQEAVAVAERLAHPLSLTEALFFAAGFHSLRGEGQVARERAEAAMALSTKHEFPYWLAWGSVEQGWALTEQGQTEEGIARIQQGLAAFQAMGAELMRINFLPRLAAAYAKVGRIEEGLSVVAEGLAFADKTGAYGGEAGLYVLKGWLLLAHPGDNQAEAEACFRQAIDITRRQSGKSVELVAVMSLSRLWQRQGKTKQAHKMLSEIYYWFTEGFDTKDLQEAKALLAELGEER